MTPRTEAALDFGRIRQMLADRCGSPMGSGLAWKAAFARRLPALETWLDQTAAMRRLLAEPAHPSTGCGDVRPVLAGTSAMGSLLDAPELVEVAGMMQVVRELKAFLEDHAELAAPLAGLAADLVALPAFESAVAKAIAPDGTIRDAASPALKAARDRVRTTRDEIMAALKREMASPGWKGVIQDTTIVSRRDRFAIPVKNDFKGRVNGIILDTSASGETVFMEPQSVVRLNNDHTDARLSVVIEERNVLRALTAPLVEHHEALATSTRAFGALDFIMAKARLALDLRATRPLMNADGVFHLRDARHPLLSGDIVPVDLRLGGEWQALVITGPNTGGKTVAMKTLATLVLMAHLGLFIPCQDDGRVGLVDRVLTDIGDDQSILESLSTFSGHLLRIREILAEATEHSLVLLDELGTGTDPREGSAIGIAILETLLERHARIMVTTHMGQIKAFAQEHPGCETACCEFDVRTLEPRFRILYGATGQSNALAIARRLGLPKDVLDRARQIHDGSRDHADRMAERLERERQRFQRLSSKLELDAREVARREKALQEAEAKLALQRQEFSDSLRRSKSESVRDARRELLVLLEDVRRAVADGGREEVVRQALRQVEALGADLPEAVSGPPSTEESPITAPPAELREGSRVRVEGLVSTGIVRSIDPRKGEAAVAVGKVTMHVPVRELEVLPDPAPGAAPMEPGWRRYLPEDPGPELHLLGMRADQARLEARSYLEKAVAAGRDHCRIIHGIGTGALRQVVEEVVRDFPDVAAHRFGRPDEGGFGATLVFLGEVPVDTPEAPGEPPRAPSLRIRRGSRRITG